MASQDTLQDQGQQDQSSWITDLPTRRAFFRESLRNTLVCVILRPLPGKDDVPFVPWTSVLAAFSQYISYIRSASQPQPGVLILDVVNYEGSRNIAEEFRALSSRKIGFGHGPDGELIECLAHFSGLNPATIEPTLNHFADNLMGLPPTDQSINPLLFYSCPYFTGTDQIAQPRALGYPASTPTMNPRERAARVIDLLGELDDSILEQAWERVRGEVARRGRMQEDEGQEDLESSVESLDQGTETSVSSLVDDEAPSESSVQAPAESSRAGADYYSDEGEQFLSAEEGDEGLSDHVRNLGPMPSHSEWDTLYQLGGVGGSAGTYNPERIVPLIPSAPPGPDIFGSPPGELGSEPRDVRFNPFQRMNPEFQYEPSGAPGFSGPRESLPSEGERPIATPRRRATSGPSVGETERTGGPVPAPRGSKPTPKPRVNRAMGQSPVPVIHQDDVADWMFSRRPGKEVPNGPPAPRFEDLYPSDTERPSDPLGLFKRANPPVGYSTIHQPAEEPRGPASRECKRVSRSGATTPECIGAGESRHSVQGSTTGANPILSPLIAQLQEKTILQTSEILSKSLVKSLKAEGAFRTDTPRLDNFSGDEEVKGVSWELWSYQVKSLELTHTPSAIREAMIKSLKGTAAEVVKSLGQDISWKQLLEALRVKFQVVGSLATLNSKLYSMRMSDKQSVSAYSIAVENALSELKLRFPKNFPQEVCDQTLREKFFDGLPDYLKQSVRYKYDNPAVSYASLLQTAREVEAEGKTNGSSSSGSGSSQDKDKTKEKDKDKVKAKVHVAAIAKPESDPQLAKLEQQYNSTSTQLQTLQKQLGDINSALSSLYTQGHPSQPSSSNSNSNWNRGKGRGRGNNNNNGGRWQQQQQGSGSTKGRPGYTGLCYWCRDFDPENANHHIRDCPKFKLGLKDWWGTQKGLPVSQVQQESQPAATSQSKQNQGN